MSFTLFADQQIFYNDIRNCLALHRQIIACAPTGAGKSKIITTAANAAVAASLTVLVITESDRIYGQLREEMPVIDINAGVKRYFIKPGERYLAMAQTLVRRHNLIDQFVELAADGRLIVIYDEAHIGTATKLLLNFKATGTLMIGFTATPAWKWAKHLTKLYNEIVVGPQTEYLVSIGRLNPCRHFARVGADLDKLKVVGGEYSDESQEQVFSSREVYAGLEEDLHKIAHRKAIVFVASVKQAEDTHRELTDKGFACIRVHYQRTPAEDKYDMMQFKGMDSGVNICICVASLTKGWDFPPVDLVVLFRKTTSLPLYLQMIGRGSRLYTGNGYTKTEFTVLDYGSNWITHGLWDAHRDWAELWKAETKRRAAGVAPVKLCPKCEYIVSSSKMTCPNCGHVFEVIERPLAEGSELVEVTARYRAEIVGKKVSDLTPEELALYAKLKKKNAYCIRVARAQDKHRQPGFLEAYAAAMNYKPGWVARQYAAQHDEEVIEFFDYYLR